MTTSEEIEKLRLEMQDRELARQSAERAQAKKDHNMLIGQVVTALIGLAGTLFVAYLTHGNKVAIEKVGSENKNAIIEAKAEASDAKIVAAEVKDAIPKVAAEVTKAIEQRDPKLELMVDASVASAKSWNAYNTKRPDDVDAAAQAVQKVEAMVEARPEP